MEEVGLIPNPKIIPCSSCSCLIISIDHSNAMRAVQLGQCETPAIGVQLDERVLIQSKVSQVFRRLSRKSCVSYFLNISSGRKRGSKHII